MDRLSFTNRFQSFLLIHIIFSKSISFGTIGNIDISTTDFDNDYGNTSLLVLSQSGETRYVYRAMEIAKPRNIFIISIVNVVNSLIARRSRLRYILIVVDKMVWHLPNLSLSK